MSQHRVWQNMRMTDSKNCESDVIRELSPGSMEEIEILEIFYKTFLDLEKQKPMHDISISVVKNPELERQFIEKRNEMYAKGCTNDELNEQFVFNLAKIHVAKQIARYGVFCERNSRNSIGDGAYGVNLSMHADVALEFGICYGYKPPLTLIVHKVIHGRVRAVQEQANPNVRPLPPTSDYTSHMAKIKPTPSMTLMNRVDRSDVYIYDYDIVDNLKVRPRQILPYAFINIKTDLSEFFKLRGQSSIPRDLVPRNNSQRDWSPIPRNNNRDRSPIPRPGKDQRDWSPVPRTVNVEPRQDRRVVDLLGRQRCSAQEEDRRHHSKHRSLSSRRRDDHSNSTHERSKPSRRRDGSSSRSRDHSPTQHGRGGSEESVRRKKYYESGECTDTDGVSGQDDVMQRVVTDDGRVILQVTCSNDTSGLESVERSRPRQRHRSRDRSKHHSKSRKRSYSRHSPRSREKHRDKSRTQSGDGIVAEDVDGNNNQLGFGEEKVLNREMCDRDRKRSLCTTSTTDNEFESVRSRNNSGRKSATGSAQKAEHFCDLREMLSGPPQGLPDLREKLTVSDLRHRLSSVPVPNLRDQIYPAPLPDLRETLMGNTLPDLRESLSVKKKFQTLPRNRRFVGTGVSPLEIRDPREPVMYEDIQTFTTNVQGSEESQVCKQNIQTKPKLEGGVKKEFQVDYSFHNKIVTSQSDSDIILSDLPDISDVEVNFEDEGLTTVDDTDKRLTTDDNDGGFKTVDDTDEGLTTDDSDDGFKTVDDTDEGLIPDDSDGGFKTIDVTDEGLTTNDGFKTVDDTETSDKLVINESPVPRSAEKASKWITTNVAISPILIPNMSLKCGAPSPSEKDVTNCSPLPVTEQKGSTVSEENRANNSPLLLKIENNFSTPKRFMVTDCMSPRSPGTPDLPEFRSLSSRFGSLTSCTKNKGSDQEQEEKITKASLLDSTSTLSINSSFSVVENLRKIRVSVEESQMRSNSPSVGLDRVDGEIKLATVQPMEISSETSKIRKRKLEEKIIVDCNLNDLLDKAADAPKIRKVDGGTLGCNVQNKLDFGEKLGIEKISVDCNDIDISGVNTSEVKPFDVDGSTVNDNPECSSSSSSNAAADPSSVTTEFIIKALLQQKKLAETDQDREAVEIAVNILMQNVNVVEHAIKTELIGKLVGGALTVEKQNRTNFEARPESLLEEDDFSPVKSLGRDETGSDLSQLGEEFDVDLADFEELDDTVCPGEEPLIAVTGTDNSEESESSNDEESVCETGHLNVSCSSCETSTANDLVALSRDSVPCENIESISVDIIPPVGRSGEIPKDENLACEDKAHEKTRKVSQSGYWDSENTKVSASVESRSPPATIDENEKENCSNQTNMNPKDMDMESSSDDDTGIELPLPVSYRTSAASRNRPLHYVEHDEMYSPMQRLEGIYSSNSYKASGWQSNNNRRGRGRGFSQPHYTPRYNDATHTLPQNANAPFKRNYGFVRTDGSAGAIPSANLRNPDRTRDKVEKKERPVSLTNKGMRYEDAIIDTQSVPRNRRESGDQNAMFTATGTFYTDNSALQNRDNGITGLNTSLQPPCLLQVPIRPQYIHSNGHASAYSHAPSSQVAQFAQHMQNSQPYFYNEQRSRFPTFHGFSATVTSIDPVQSDGVKFSPYPPSPPPPPPPKRAAADEEVKKEEKEETPSNLIKEINTSGSFLDLRLPPKSPKKKWNPLKRITIDASYPNSVVPARPTFYDYRGGKMLIRYAEEATANVKTHPGLGVATQTLTKGQSVQDTKKYFEERRQNKAVGSKSCQFHGRTLLKGQVEARKIPLEPLYLQHPYKKSGKLELIPTDPRPAYYSMLRQEKTQGLQPEMIKGLQQQSIKDLQPQNQSTA